MNILIVDFSHKRQLSSETVNLYYTVAATLQSFNHHIGLVLLKTKPTPAGFDADLYDLGCYMADLSSTDLTCWRLGESTSQSNKSMPLSELQRLLEVDLLHVCTLGIERHGNLFSLLRGPLCVDCHDCASRHRFRELKHDLKENKRRVPKAVLKLFYDLFRELKLLRLRSYERVYTLVSAGDAAWFGKMAPRTPSRWIQPHVMPLSDLARKRPKVVPFSVGFWGVSGIWNEAAFDELINRVLPIVQKKYPECIVKVFGHISDKKQERCKLRSDILFEGYVENLRESVQACEICCFPFRYGSGVKTKLLECMNWGVPCVTTCVGAEGLRNDQRDGLLVGRSASHIADLCIMLFEDKVKQNELIKRGFDIINTGFSKENAMASYLDAYAEITNPNI